MAELNKIIKRIMVDTADPHRNTTVRTKQGDKATRCVSVLILDNGKEYEIPADAVLRVNFQKPDGHYCYNTATRDADTNRVLVNLTNQMLAVAGRAECEVEITTPDASQTLTSAVFAVEVERGLHNEEAIKSADEMTALEETIAKAEQAAEDAKTASDKAVEAAGKVEEVHQAAKDAQAAAEAAKAAAQTAQEQAEQSEEKAVAAEQAAATAKEQAEAARTAAEASENKATTAGASAEKSAQEAQAANEKATAAAANAQAAAGKAAKAAAVHLGWDTDGYFSIIEEDT